jgi:hypothetical protein
VPSKSCLSSTKHRPSYSDEEELDFDGRTRAKRIHRLRQSGHQSAETTDGSDKSDEPDNDTLIEQQIDRLRQDSPEDIWRATDSGKRPDSYRAIVERVVAHLERHLHLCALCSSWP